MNKKLVIERVAFVEKCSFCESHAHIRYSDGSTSGEFFSRVDGHKVVSEASRCGLIAADNAKELHREIDEFQFIENISILKLGTMMKRVMEHSEEIYQILIQKIDEARNETVGCTQLLPGEAPLEEEDDEKDVKPKLN